MTLSHLNHTEQAQLLDFLNTGILGPVGVTCAQEAILAILGEPDFINIQYFGPVEPNTQEILAAGRTQNIRIEIFEDYDHHLTLEYHAYGMLQITFKDHLVSHFTLMYHLRDEGWPAALDAGWLNFLGKLTHQELKTLFVERNLDQHIFYYQGYESEGPMLIRPDMNFDIDFAIGAEGPSDKVTISEHRERGLPLIHIDLQ